MSDWYSFPTYNPYSPSSPYVSNNGMMPTPNDIAASRLRTMGGGGGYRNDPSQFDQNDYQTRVAHLGAIAALMTQPQLAAALGMGGAMYGAMAPTSVNQAEAAPKQQQAALPQAPALAAPTGPMSDEDKEIAKLEAERDKAVEIGRHSKQAGDMSAAQTRFEEASKEVRDRYRGQRELETYRTGMKQDPTFQGFPAAMQTGILNAPSMDEANKAYNTALNKTTPFAQRNPELVQNLEMAAMGLGGSLPILHNMYDLAALRSAASAAGGGGDLAAGSLRALVNPGQSTAASLGNEALRFGAHAAGGTALPLAAGTVFPNLMDTFTLPHDSAAYRHAQTMLDPTSPEFLQALKRSAIEGGISALGGGILGHTMFRPDLARARGAGILNALDARAPAASPALAESTWSTPVLRPINGAPAINVRKKDARGGYLTVIEGK